MYAVIRAKGHQFMVEEGETLSVPHLQAEAGDHLTFNEVLFIGDPEGKTAAKVGHPCVDGATVEAEVLRNKKEKKIVVFKKKRRHGYQKKQGHRTEVTEVKILKIKG